MRNFKFFNNNSSYFGLALGPMQRLIIEDGLDRNNVEYCYQFNDNEPVSFANGPGSLTITVNPDGYNGLSFEDADNNLSFKIFSRDIE